MSNKFSQSSQEGNTSKWVKSVVRPEFLAVFGGFIATLITVGIAWGVVTQRVEGHDKSIEALWKVTGENKASAQNDHDTIIRIDANVAELIRHMNENTIEPNNFPHKH